MRAYVGVTDGGRYRFLAARPKLAEVNFWRPHGRHAFRALESGEPFFFKTHYPRNKIVGGGFFSGFVPMRVSDARELPGPGNGAASWTATATFGWPVRVGSSQLPLGPRP